MRILITGASGMLGTTLAPLLADAGHDVVRHGKNAATDACCDLTDKYATKIMLGQVRPDVVINLVAWTNVDKCEEDPHGAYLLNVRTVENLAAGLRDCPDAHLVHVSTDQVYDTAGPSREDEIRLTNIYALTKYAGELAAGLTSSTVLRTNFFGRSALPGRKSFSDWLLDSLHDGRPLTVFTDVVMNPLSMTTLSAMIARVAEKQVKGVFNLGSHGAMSKADFAVELAKAHGLATDNMKLGLSSDVDLRAYRPKDMSMDCGSFEAAFNVVLPSLQHEIKDLKRNADALT